MTRVGIKDDLVIDVLRHIAVHTDDENDFVTHVFLAYLVADMAAGGFKEQESVKNQLSETVDRIISTINANGKVFH